MNSWINLTARWQAVVVGLIAAGLAALFAIGMVALSQSGHPHHYPPPVPEGAKGMEVRVPAFLSSIIGWLRAGYPEGVPDVDYIPLFALLGSQLSDADMTTIAGELTSSAENTVLKLSQPGQIPLIRRHAGQAASNPAQPER